MLQIPGLYVANSDERGRGVFASEPIQTGDVIEICPILLLPSCELPIIHKTFLHDYYFLWGEEQNQAAIALGYGSIYNHLVHCNADFILDYEHETIEIVAIKDIALGEEITINYLGESGDDGKVWFEVK